MSCSVVAPIKNRHNVSSLRRGHANLFHVQLMAGNKQEGAFN
jgi:hypothetical protein